MYKKRLRLYFLDLTPVITVIIYSDSNTFIRTEKVSVKEGVEKLEELNRKFRQLNFRKRWKITLPDRINTICKSAKTFCLTQRK